MSFPFKKKLSPSKSFFLWGVQLGEIPVNWWDSPCQLLRLSMSTGGTRIISISVIQESKKKTHSTPPKIQEVGGGWVHEIIYEYNITHTESHVFVREKRRFFYFLQKSCLMIFGVSFFSLRSIYTSIGNHYKKATHPAVDRRLCKFQFLAWIHGSLWYVFRMMDTSRITKQLYLFYLRKAQTAMDLLWFIYVDLSRSLDKNDHPQFAVGVLYQDV